MLPSVVLVVWFTAMTLEIVTSGLDVTFGLLYVEETSWVGGGVWRVSRAGPGHGRRRTNEHLNKSAEKPSFAA